jgi:hypothetical protein
MKKYDVVIYFGPVNAITDIVAKDEKELSKIIYGISCVYGTPDSYEISNVSDVEVFIYPDLGQWDTKENFISDSTDFLSDGGSSIKEQIAKLIPYDEDKHILNLDGTVTLKEDL